MTDSPSTQSVLTAVSAAAHRFDRPVRITEEIGADRTSAALTAAPSADPAEFFAHEALIELGGQPAVEVCLFTHEDARVTVDGVAFDVPKASVAAFLAAVWSGLAHVRTRAFPPATTLVVAVPGEPSYREPVPLPTLTPWLARITR
ncbi:hypothetical protein CFP65_4523 [Kitasatospora sp. MMS16-BH015]|uniref:hypothetical protein n=1 Tax=Kitasatospora sp. MMS16-BH015 TaxID=2018025 RepID=UPI000CA29C15|nr:hypothetical protein [Kitasatospora sp. MMS16-BH015]AUG79270.1 hypothetical protein CFP65_4523 [Kitasatospora sp. MMS16-BH015]